MNRQIRVLVCDDSALMRKLIKEIIESDPTLQVVATAPNGLFALKKIPIEKPDIIILDIEMPEMNGLEFLAACKKQKITIPVIVLSSLVKRGAKVTIQALELGAKDFLMKPSGSISHDIGKVSEELCRLIHIYAEKNLLSSNIDFREELDKPVVCTTSVAAKDNPESSFMASAQKSWVKDQKADHEKYMKRNNLPEVVSLRPRHGKVEIVVIGISTGGPVALRTILPKIPANFPKPILIVQHMPEDFTKEFADSLNAICPLNVVEAKEGDLVRPGRILIAPGNKHMELRRMELASIVSLNSNPPENGHRPSVDVLFRSANKFYGSSVLAVIMTGMGRDGAKEMGYLYNSGAYTLAQDQNSCVVYGMPRVAVESGYADEVLPLEKIPERIIQLSC